MQGQVDPLLGELPETLEVDRHFPDSRQELLAQALNPNALPTIGANGCMIRRRVLDSLTWTPYFFDIDVVYQAVLAGHDTLAKVKCGIVHLYGRNLLDFARKQDRRIKDYLYFSSAQKRSYPWDCRNRTGIMRFIIGTILLFPLLAQMARGWRRVPDRAWWLHIPACWITLVMYGRAVIARRLGIHSKARSRSGWRQ